MLRRARGRCVSSTSHGASNAVFTDGRGRPSRAEEVKPPRSARVRPAEEGSDTAGLLRAMVTLRRTSLLAEDSSSRAPNRHARRARREQCTSQALEVLAAAAEEGGS